MTSHARTPETHPAALGAGWVWPWWLERQLDPAGPDLQVGEPRNVTHRSWTTTGALSSPDRAAVDPRGLVSPAPGSWSLDWWVGAEDGWHFPSRSAAVRQGLVDATPVVETRMRIPGGDAVHRTYGVHAGDDGGEPLLVVEIENRSAVAVAVALALRPASLTGLGDVASVRLDGTELWVDDRLAVELPRPPARVAFGNGASGDLAVAVAAGVETAPGDERTPTFTTCPDGRAQCVLIYPLPHTATLRVALPLAPGRRRVRTRRAPEPRPLPTLAASDAVARGWHTQAARGMRVTLPAGRLADLVDANRRHLLLAAADEDLAGWPVPRFRFADAAVVLSTLDTWGFPDEVERVLGTWSERQALDGSFVDADGRVDATGAALWAVGEHWRVTRDTEVAEALLGPIAKGVHATWKRRGGRRREQRDRGLLPEGRGPRWVSLAPDVHYQDTFWAWAGLLAAADAMDPIGQPDVAAQARDVARSLEGELRASLAAAADRLGTAAIPAGPRRPIDGGVVANLVGCDPLGVLPATHPGIAATLDVVRDRFVHAGGVVQAVGTAGVSPLLTAWLGGAELESGDGRALERLDWLVRTASPTGVWPEVCHPRTGGGSVGDGHHAPAGAAFLRLVRRLLVRETATGLALCTLLPQGWEGQGFEVHDAPTRWGALSYAVRWHGERPALLWQLDQHPGAGAVELSAPGLDTGWRSTEPRGEALLAPYRSSATPVQIGGDAARDGHHVTGPVDDGSSFS